MKRLKNKLFIITILLVCVVSVFASVGFKASTLGNIYFNTRIKKVPIYAVKTDEKKVAISFDAAWGADKTEQIMDICDSFGVKATFFLVGFWVEDYPETTQSIQKRGFEIGLHSATHPDMTKLSASNQKLELIQNIDIIHSVTGQKPKLFRPPFGAYNDTLINNCNSLGLKTIQWSVDSLDWKGISADEIAQRVCSQAKCGSIVLFHNNSNNIINGLKMVLTFLINNNYQVVPVGQLVFESGYTINQQGIQIKN